MTSLRAGRLFDGDRMFGPTELTVRDGLVADLRPVADRELDDPERDRVIAPGFVDMQINGYDQTGFAVCTVEEYEAVLDRMPLSGVTSVVTTFPSRAVGDQIASARLLGASSWRPGRARTAGFHFEGPFISHARRGAHPADLLDSLDGSALGELLAARADGVPILKVTIAPELPGALAAIRSLVAEGIVVALGHSDADHATAVEGFLAGASIVTHLFNAQSQLTARAPGMVGAALTTEGVTLGLIADFVHVHPAACRLAFAAAGGRVALVTDQSPHEGGPASTPRLDDGTLAGSSLYLDEAIRNIRSLGVPDSLVLGAATSVPADALGLPHAGRLRIGAPADIVMLDGAWNVTETFVGGTRAG